MQQGAFPPPQAWAGQHANYGAAGDGAAGDEALQQYPSEHSREPFDAEQPFSRAVSDDEPPSPESPIYPVQRKLRRAKTEEMSLQKQDIELHQDTYSWLMLTLVKCWQGSDEDEEGNPSALAAVTNISLIHAVTVWALSIFLELCVIIFFTIGNTELGEKVQDSYFREKYHMDLGRAAEVLNQAANDGVEYRPPDILEACVQQAAWANMIWIYYVTICFWLMTMVIEIKEATWLAIHILGVQKKSPLTDAGVRNQKRLFHEDIAIVRLETWMKGTLIVLIPFLRLSVAFVLTFAGSTYLVLTTNATEMVIRTVALQFVIRMDDVSAHALLTMGDLTELGKIKLRTTWGHPGRHSLWDKGLGGMCYIFVIAVSMLMLTEVVYRDLFAFRYACGAYHARFHIPGVTDMMPSLR